MGLDLGHLDLEYLIESHSNRAEGPGAEPEKGGNGVERQGLDDADQFGQECDDWNEGIGLAVMRRKKPIYDFSRGILGSDPQDVREASQDEDKKGDGRQERVERQRAGHESHFALVDQRDNLAQEANHRPT